MELRAVIEGLRALKKERLAVTVYSDSRYVVDMFSGGYAARWRAHGWMRNARDRAENPDLWGELLDICGRHQVTFTWVRGHSANPHNERCDLLAVNARQAANLPPDTGYERVRGPEGGEAPQVVDQPPMVNPSLEQAVFDWAREK